MKGLLPIIAAIWGLALDHFDINWILFTTLTLRLIRHRLPCPPLAAPPPPPRPLPRGPLGLVCPQSAGCLSLSLPPLSQQVLKESKRN